MAKRQRVNELGSMPKNVQSRDIPKQPQIEMNL